MLGRLDETLGRAGEDMDDVPIAIARRLRDRVPPQEGYRAYLFPEAVGDIWAGVQSMIGLPKTGEPRSEKPGKTQTT